MVRLPARPFAGGVDLGRGIPPTEIVQPSLFPKRVSTRYPLQPAGADIAFVCEVSEGGTYYCKDDTRGRPVRMTDWICTQLANHLGIATADCAIVEDESGNTYFGSLQDRSTALRFSADDYLRRPQKGELGQPLEWLGRYLSRLYVLDLFIDNPDRDMPNFVLQAEGRALRLCAIDFAAANLLSLPSVQFPIAHGRTLPVGKLLRHLHDFFEESALEMIDRIAAVPQGIFAGFFSQIPADWASETQRDGIIGSWQE